MNGIKKILRTCLALAMLAIIGVTLPLSFAGSLILWCVTAPFDPNRKVLHLYSCYCMAFWLYLMPDWHIRVDGREKIRKDKVYVIICNHQSLLDILIAAQLFTHFKYVSKAEVTKIPMIGWQLALNRYILIRRGYVNSISKMMTDCEHALAQGSSILLFPEGTRSKDGQIMPFKPGAFILAEKQHAPVLPVVIYGTRDAIPIDSRISLDAQRIWMKVLDPIPYEEYSQYSHEENLVRVRTLMAKHLKLMEKRLELGLS